MKVGDVVQLKSGGPRMTVRTVKMIKVEEKDCFLIRCQWFVADDVLDGDFIQDMLNTK